MARPLGVAAGPNARFEKDYSEGFGALDVEKMEAVWQTSERALCVHSGWQPLVDSESIRSS